jgi:phytoene desaturase
MKTSQQIQRDQYDAVIIGSGMAGLVCATRLTQAGLKVMVLEQHFIPGGATSMFSRGGFRFEAGGHRISGIRTPGAILYELYKSIGKEIKTHPLDPLYVVKLGDKVLPACKDLEQYQENLIRLFPQERAGICRYIQDLVTLSRSQQAVQAARGKINLLEMISKHRLFAQYSGKTSRQVLNHYFKNEQLVMMASMLGVYTTLPLERQSFLNFANMWAVHHLGEGMSLVEGGTDALIAPLVDFIVENGGEVVVSQPVEQILVENKRAVGVRTLSGTVVKTRVVISAASSEQTYLKLLDPALLPSAFCRKIKNQEPSGSLFQLFLGLSEQNGSGLENTTTFVGPYPWDDPLKKVYEWDLDTITSMGVITVEGPEHAPSGCRSVNISCLCPYDHPQNWYLPADSTSNHRPVDRSRYRAFKNELAQKVIHNMERYLPGLKKRITVMETATPLTIERYTSATKGGLQGLAHTLEQSGNKRGTLTTPIPGLYHTGQYTFPGAGIVTVAVSADICSKIVLHELNS